MTSDVEGIAVVGVADGHANALPCVGVERTAVQENDGTTVRARPFQIMKAEPVEHDIAFHASRRVRQRPDRTHRRTRDSGRRRWLRPTATVCSTALYSEVGV